MLHHIALRTNNPTQLADFYVRVCGLQVVPNPPASASGLWLHAGGVVFMVERREADEPGPASGTLDLLAFEAAQPDVHAVLAFLAEQRVEVEACTGFTAYFRDPDGRRVALSTYPLPTPVESIRPR
ncbi:MAG: VOC family protein [Myxococcales bacterium]|nr:VOC family protein [Myxococcales bacterium]